MSDTRRRAPNRLAWDSRSQTSALAVGTVTHSADRSMLGMAAAGGDGVVSHSQRQFSTLDDRPGTLAKVTDAIASAGINIEGYAAVPSGKDGKGVFRVITKDPASTKKALEGAGFKVQEERDVALVEVDDRPGVLAQILRRVAENEVNVGPTYSITQNRIAISADDFGKLREALQELSPTARRR